MVNTSKLATCLCLDSDSDSGFIGRIYCDYFGCLALHRSLIRESVIGSALYVYGFVRSVTIDLMAAVP